MHIHSEFILVTCYSRLEYKICNFEVQLNTFLSQLQTECKSASTYILHERELSSKRPILNNATKSMALAYSKTVAWRERRGGREKGEGKGRGESACRDAVRLVSKMQYSTANKNTSMLLLYDVLGEISEKLFRTLGFSSLLKMHVSIRTMQGQRFLKQGSDILN